MHVSHALAGTTEGSISIEFDVILGAMRAEAPVLSTMAHEADAPDPTIAFQVAPEVLEAMAWDDATPPVTVKQKQEPQKEDLRQTVRMQNGERTDTRTLVAVRKSPSTPSLATISVPRDLHELAPTSLMVDTAPHEFQPYGAVEELDGADLEAADLEAIELATRSEPTFRFRNDNPASSFAVPPPPPATAIASWAPQERVSVAPSLPAPRPAGRVAAILLSLTFMFLLTGGALDGRVRAKVTQSAKTVVTAVARH